MRQTKRLVALFVMFVMGIFVAGCSGEMVLVEQHKPLATLVVAKDAPVTVLFAAEELQTHLEKMTGTRLPQVTDDKKVDGPVVLVGESSLTRAMNLKSDDFKRQEYLVRVEPGRMVLIGRDRKIGGVPTPERDKPYNGFLYYDAIGTCYAVYHFLESCGVRWYLPTEIGTVIPEKPTLVVPGGKVRRRPATKYRYQNMANKRTPTSLYAWDRENLPREDKGEVAPMRETTLWNMRMRVQGDAFVANHSHYHWYQRFKDSHPEYFAKGRTFNSGTQLCWTHPEVIAQTVKDADDFFSGRPVPGLGRAQGDYFSLVPMDHSSYCKCERCAKYFKIKKKRIDGFNSDQYSQYIWTFVNEVAKGVRKVQPDKFVSALAYARYFEPPVNLILEPNVAVMLCLQSDRWGYWPEARKYNEAQVAKWAKVIEHPYVWLYLNFPQHKKNDRFPALIAHEYARQMRLFHKAGLEGIFLEMTSDLYGLDKKGRTSFKVWPNPMEDFFTIYVILKMADDPALDENVILDEFYGLFYGNAAGPIKAFVEKAEKIYNDPKLRDPNRHIHNSLPESWHFMCPSKTLAEFEELIKQAYKLADTPKARARVKIFDEGIYQSMVAGREKWKVGARLMEQKGRWLAVATRLGRKAGTKGLDGLDWSKAQTLPTFLSMEAGACKIKTDARIGYDDKNIYFRIFCHDKKTKAILRKHKKRDSYVFMDDAVEIFISPKLEKDGNYKQYVVNAAGVLFDGAKGKDALGESWNGNAKSRARIEKGKGWLVELAIPFTDLVSKPAKSSDFWRINICRDYRGMVSLSQWRPTYSTFHAPGLFGRMTFE